MVPLKMLQFEPPQQVVAIHPVWQNPARTPGENTDSVGTSGQRPSPQVSADDRRFGRIPDYFDVDPPRKPDAESIKCVCQRRCVSKDGKWGWCQRKFAVEKTQCGELREYMKTLAGHESKWARDCKRENECLNLVGFGTDGKGCRIIAPPYFCITAKIPKDKIPSPLVKTPTEDVALAGLVTRARTTLDWVDEGLFKNHALGDDWVCYFHERTLVMLSTQQVRPEVSELMDFCIQAVSFKWCASATLNAINYELDNWSRHLIANGLLVKYGSSSPPQSTSDVEPSSQSPKRKTLYEALDELNRLRKSYMQMLMDPTFRAFPGATVHELLREADRAFRVRQAKELLAEKFEMGDRLLEDSLQLQALKGTYR